MKSKIMIKDIAYIAVMVAIIEVCKTALSFLPNIELTSFWIIMFMLFLGKRTYFAVPVFILIEGAIYGFGLWWLMYLYAWPLLALITWIFKKVDSVIFWSVLSSIFGLSFGFLCSIPYFFIGLSNGNIKAALTTQFTWWIAGIPWDIVHGIGNFVMMFVLYIPVSRAMNKIVKKL